MPQAAKKQLPDLPITRSNAIPLETLVYYRKKGLTYEEVAKQCGCTKANVIQRMHYHGLADNSLDHYVNHRVDVLRYWQRKILDSITSDDLKKANFSSKIMGYGILYDKERLETGQSTGNIAVIIDHIESLQRQVAR